MTRKKQHAIQGDEAVGKIARDESAEYENRAIIEAFHKARLAVCLLLTDKARSEQLRGEIYSAFGVPLSSDNSFSSADAKISEMYAPHAAHLSDYVEIWTASWNSSFDRTWTLHGDGVDKPANHAQLGRAYRTGGIGALLDQVRLIRRQEALALESGNSAGRNTGGVPSDSVRAHSVAGPAPRGPAR